MNKPVKSQLVVTFDGEKFQAEIPKAGGRRVIDLPRDATQWGQILEPELIESRFWLQDRAQETLRQEQEAQAALREAKTRFNRSRHFRIWDTTAQNHGLSFAAKTIGQRDARHVDPRLNDLKGLL